MQHAKKTKSSFSRRPSSRLQRPQLGAVHRSRPFGVVSGYQELGNTWSLVVRVRVSRQWIHLPSLFGRLVVTWRCTLLDASRNGNRRNVPCSPDDASNGDSRTTLADGADRVNRRKREGSPHYSRLYEKAFRSAHSNYSGRPATLEA